MKSPRLIRPLFLIGIIVLALAVFSWLLLPGWRSSVGGVLILALSVVAGLAAIFKDISDLRQEMKDLNPPDDKSN